MRQWLRPLLVCFTLSACAPSACGPSSDFPPLQTLPPGYCVAWGRIWPAHKDGENFVCLDKDMP